MPENQLCSSNNVLNKKSVVAGSKSPGNKKNNPDVKIWVCLNMR